MKTNIKKTVIAAIALTLAITTMAGGAGAYTNDESLYPAQPETLDVTMERSGHNYVYYQMFTGRWYEDENNQIWLTDAGFGKDLNSEKLIEYLKANYADTINDIYVKRAVASKLVDEGATIDDVKTAYEKYKGDGSWLKSDYNINNFSLAEDVLDVLKAIQASDTSKVGEDGELHITGTDYGESDAHDVYVTNGNKTVIDILRMFKAGDGTTIEADYNETVTIPVDNGYYMVLETDNGWDNEGRDTVDGEPKEAVLMKIVDRAITITPKLGTPTMEKKIAENVKQIVSVGDGLVGGYDNLANETGWNDAADYSIGDDVPFALFGSMPENIRDYDHYYYCFKDRLAAGFKTPENLKIEIGTTTPVADPDDSDNAAMGRTFTGVDVTNKATVEVKEEADGSTYIKIEFDDIKSLGVDITMDTLVCVTYTAELDVDAVIGSLGNTNGAYLEFSNDLNYDGTGRTDDDDGYHDEDDGGNEGDGGGDDGFDRTPEDGVTAFTYELDVAKIDAADHELTLEGAVFTLQALDGDHAGMYVIVDDNGKVIGWTTEVEESNYLVTDEGGLTVVSGLDDGDYQLTEVKSPDGYHAHREPMVLHVNATLNDNGTYVYAEDNGSTAFIDFYKDDTYDETTATVNVADGIYAIDVLNNKGITLPRTGGAGTIALYAAGTIGVIAGGLYFALKKDNKKKED